MVKLVRSRDRSNTCKLIRQECSGPRPQLLSPVWDTLQVPLSHTKFPSIELAASFTVSEYCEGEVMLPSIRL